MVHYVHDTTSTYVVLFTLLFLHIWANVNAVRVVVLRTLNRQRANIMWTAYRPKTSGRELPQFLSTLRTDEPFCTGNLADLRGISKILTPEAVSAREYIFANGSALYDRSARGLPSLGRCHIGSSFAAITSNPSAQLTSQSSKHGLKAPDTAQIRAILDFFEEEKYVLWFDPHATGTCCMHVCLKEGHKPMDHLKAWAHAQEIGRILDGRAPGSFDVALSAVEIAYRLVEEAFPAFSEGIMAAGWKVDEGGMIAGSPRVLLVEMSAEGHTEEDRKNV